MEKSLPLPSDNPTGLHQKYVIRKVIEGKDDGYFGFPKIKTKAVDKDAEYFVLRLDEGCKDKIHLQACRRAVLHYANLIKEHLPDLSKDLIARYS